MKKYCISIIIILVIALSFSCSRKEEALVINLPPIQVLEQRTNYAVITSSHLRLRTEPSVRSQAIVTLWKGYILEVVSRSSRMDNVDGLDNFWYQVRYGGLRGWVFGAYIKLVPTYEQAKEEAQRLKS
ncbi:MAG: SH3 domain-containing protein [Spirochaetaceae bacterium]|nr:SH3 domain-containing protein [Spirochaetaceae bacterium]